MSAMIKFNYRCLYTKKVVDGKMVVGLELSRTAYVAK